MRLRHTLLCAASLALMTSACGGGGGGVNTPSSQAPPPSPPPAPAPAPPAPGGPIIGGQEYSRSNAAAQADAITAYEQGVFGEGVTIAILDSGIDTTNPEFAGRIHPASADFGGSGTIADPDGHGTAVAAVAAAADDEEVFHGLAPLATILVARVDETGTCAGMDGCSYPDSIIAQGVDLAVAQGAGVINMSLGGSPAAPALLKAIDRATAAGVIIVISAGNDGESQPDSFAQVALDPAARGLVVIAGSVDPFGQSSDFSNKAGIGADHYIAALGERVLSYDQNQELFRFSGTSFSAPAIAGAIALLIDAFPTLTPDEIVELLFESARDRGTPGIDTIFGHGELDLGEAFSPSGTLTVAGTKIGAFAVAEPFVTGGAAGDAGAALSGALGQVVATDRFDRAFSVNLSGEVSTLQTSGIVRNALALAERSVGARVGQAGLSFSAAQTGLAPTGSLEARGLDARAGGSAPIRRGLASVDLTPALAATAAYGYSAASLAPAARGERASPAWLDNDWRDGRLAGQGAAVAYRTGGWTFAAAYASETSAFTTGTKENQAQTLRVTAATTLGDTRLGVSLDQLREDRGFLGSSDSTLFGLAGSDTSLAGLAVTQPLGSGWSLAAAGRLGLTRLEMDGSGLASGADRLLSSEVEIALERTALFRADDRFGLRLSQPLRVELGGLHLALPTGYDYLADAPVFTDVFAALTPSGRELMLEAAYGFDILGGTVGANAFVRRDPGHRANQPADAGAVLRVETRF